MEAILSGLQIILAVVVIVLILLHSGKDAGLSGAFGVGTGAGPFGGGSLVERNLNRWTVFFALLFVANVIVLLKICSRPPPRAAAPLGPAWAPDPARVIGALAGGAGEADRVGSHRRA